VWLLQNRTYVTKFAMCPAYRGKASDMYVQLAMITTECLCRTREAFAWASKPFTQTCLATCWPTNTTCPNLVPTFGVHTSSLACSTLEHCSVAVLFSTNVCIRPSCLKARPCQAPPITHGVYTLDTNICGRGSDTSVPAHPLPATKWTSAKTANHTTHPKPLAPQNRVPRQHSASSDIIQSSPCFGNCTGSLNTAAVLDPEHTPPAQPQIPFIVQTEWSAIHPDTGSIDKGVPAHTLPAGRHAHHTQRHTKTTPHTLE
jgi:hypothetical protein